MSVVIDWLVPVSSLPSAPLPAWDSSGVAASLVAYHASLSTTHNVSGDIVGTTDTQTLTNKVYYGDGSHLTGLSHAVDDLALTGGTLSGFLTVDANTPDPDTGFVFAVVNGDAPMLGVNVDGVVLSGGSLRLSGVGFVADSGGTLSVNVWNDFQIFSENPGYPTLTVGSGYGAYPAGLSLGPGGLLALDDTATLASNGSGNVSVSGTWPFDAAGAAVEAVATSPAVCCYMASSFGCA